MAAETPANIQLSHVVPLRFTIAQAPANLPPGAANVLRKSKNPLQGDRLKNRELNGK